MIHLECTITSTTVADFPDNFRIHNGDGLTIIKNPDTNEIVLQVPSANTLIYKRPNPQQATPPGVPPSMQGNA